MRLSPLLLLLLPLASALAATPWPRVTEIRFEGNKVTRESVLLREFDIAPGDPADPVRIENTRQALLDLGLFREVRIEQDAVGDGVALRIVVREKRYILPIPRIDASTDRDYSFGGQLRWANVGGRNHRLTAFIEEEHYPEGRSRERERTARLSYTAPYIGPSDYGAAVAFEHREVVTPSPGGSFDERHDRVQLLGTRNFTTGRPRRGWVLGAGLYWQDHATSGFAAPPGDGRATALLGTAEYSDRHFHLYSETGRRFATRLERAFEGSLSDYGYRRWTAEYQEFLAVGSTPHQNLNFLAAAGWLHGVDRTREEFSLGGSSRLRGYRSETLEGDRFYYGAVEYLRPLGRDWLRLLLLAEIGGVDDDRDDLADGSVQASIGVGVRVRLVWFVNVELEVGVALPLRGGSGVRVFGGTN